MNNYNDVLKAFSALDASFARETQNNYRNSMVVTTSGSVTTNYFSSSGDSPTSYGTSSIGRVYVSQGVKYSTLSG